MNLILVSLSHKQSSVTFIGLLEYAGSRLGVSREMMDSPCPQGAESLAGKTKIETSNSNEPSGGL